VLFIPRSEPVPNIKEVTVIVIHQAAHSFKIFGLAVIIRLCLNCVLWSDRRNGRALIPGAPLLTEMLLLLDVVSKSNFPLG